MPILRLLLENGADPAVQDAGGKTALDVARKPAVQELFASFTAEQIQDAMQAQREKMAMRPRYEEDREASKENKRVEVQELPKKRAPKTIYYKDRGGQDDHADKKGQESDKQQFLELHPTLDIVSKPDDFALRAANTGGGYAGDVRLQSGSLIVETSEGLFASNEVSHNNPDSDPSEVRAEDWLQQVDQEVLPEMKAILAAKAQAQEHFNQGKVGDARQVTTAAIRAAELLLAKESVEEKANESLGSLLGTLRSNRSLLLTHQIQAEDSEVLQFGSHAAWALVVKDTDAALLDNPNNFKASFRRARALFELGELDQAMSDATRVVDHYARNTQVSNPEAVDLRQRIMEALKKERAKWGEKGGPRWNRMAGDRDGLISEVA